MLEFPKMLYDEHGSQVIVHDRDHQDALGDGWHEKPVAAKAAAVVSGADLKVGAPLVPKIDVLGTIQPPIAPPAPALPAATVENPASETERDALLKQAQALGLTCDGRWGAPKLRQAISEAQAKA